MGHTCAKLKSHLQQANEEDDYNSGKLRQRSATCVAPVYVVCFCFF